jgi:hypothetical protein
MCRVAAARRVAHHKLLRKTKAQNSLRGRPRALALRVSIQLVEARD